MARRARGIRYKNPSFLKALGEHCQKIRLQKGYSIDRMAREGESLGRGSIQRLELGLSDTQVLVLLRYAEVLSVPLRKLFDFKYQYESDSH
jgi:transcriptional regulator with XRE-family HTH domain